MKYRKKSHTNIIYGNQGKLCEGEPHHSNNKNMDLEADISQLIKQNLRPRFSSLTAEQQAQLDSIFAYNFDHDLFKHELMESLDDWKREEYTKVHNSIGDLQRLELGHLLDESSITFEKLNADIQKLPKFRLVDNDNDSDKGLLEEYDRLRTSLVTKCRVILKVRSEQASDINTQVIESVSSVVDVKQLRDEISLELKSLGQNLETILKSWPSLAEQDKAKIVQLIQSSELNLLLPKQKQIE